MRIKKSKKRRFGLKSRYLRNGNSNIEFIRYMQAISNLSNVVRKSARLININIDI